jgi:hypothetical protein
MLLGRAGPWAGPIQIGSVGTRNELIDTLSPFGKNGFKTQCTVNKENEHAIHD